MHDLQEASANYFFDRLDDVINSLAASRLLFPSDPVGVPGTQPLKSLNYNVLPAVPVLPSPKKEVVTDIAQTGEDYESVPDDEGRASNLLFIMGKTGTAGTPAETLGKIVPVAVPVAFLNGNINFLNSCVRSLPPGLLDAYEERAAIMQFDAGLSRSDAERLAWVEVFGRDR